LVVGIALFTLIRCSSFRLDVLAPAQRVYLLLSKNTSRGLDCGHDQNSLHAAYKKLLERRRLTPNPSQAALVDRLSRLQQSLADLNYDQGGLYSMGTRALVRRASLTSSPQQCHLAYLRVAFISMNSRWTFTCVCIMLAPLLDIVAILCLRLAGKCRMSQVLF
jgi:hypothetical protein